MDFLRWPLRCLTEKGETLPNRMLTRIPFDARGRLDSTIALLLPSDVVAPQKILEKFTARSAPEMSECLGIWMGTPAPLTASKVAASSWIGNFPASAMFDAEFATSLSEVQLGPEREIAHLRKLHDDGFKTLLTVAVGQILDADHLDAINAVLVVVQSAVDLRKLEDEYAAYLRATLGPNTPLVIYGGLERHLPRAPEKLSFSAVLENPS